MIRALLIFTAEHVASARAIAEQSPFNLSADNAAQLFVPCGSPTGDAPATHYWAAGLFSEAQAAALQQLSDSLPWAEYFEYDLKTQPGFPRKKLAEMGLQPLNAGMP